MLLNMMSKLSSVDQLSSPPLSSSSRSWDKSRDVSWSNGISSLSLSDMMSKLSSVDQLSSPPLSSSSRSRNKSGDVSWGNGISSLSLSTLSNGNMVNITVGEVGTWQTLSYSSMIHIT